MKRATSRPARLNVSSRSPSSSPSFKRTSAISVDSHGLVEELGTLIGRTRRMVWTNATRRLEASGETMLAWHVLSHLARHGRCTQTELAAGVSQHPAGISRLVDELEKGGWVRRQRDSRDRRRIHVEVTPAGLRRFRAGLPHVRAAVDHALSPLNLAERRSMRALLRKVVEVGGDPSETA